MIFIILTAYNEERDLPPLLVKIGNFMLDNSLSYRMIIVNDGSTDNTASVIKQYSATMPIDLIDFKTNRGVGEAFRVAFGEVIKTAGDSDLIVTMDADNTHDPELIKPMMQKIQEGSDVVVASCYAKEGKLTGVSFFRAILSKICNFIYILFFPIKGVTLYTGFYRLHTAGAIKKARVVFKDRFIESNGFGAMAELLVKFKKLKFNISEVPMILHYEVKQERSKIKIIPTIKEHLGSIYKNLRRVNILSLDEKKYS